MNHTDLIYEIIPLGYNSEFDQNVYYYNAYLNEELVGYCKYRDADFVTYGNGVTIEFIYVYPKYRRNGIATEIANCLKEKYSKLIWNHKFTDLGRLWYKNYNNKYERHSTKRQRIKAA